MKKATIILISLILVSCFNEPKKVKKEEIITKIKKPNYENPQTNNLNEEKQVDLNVEDKDNGLYGVSISFFEKLVSGSLDNFENSLLKKDFNFHSYDTKYQFKLIEYRKGLKIINYALDSNNIPLGNMTYDTKDKDEYLYLKSDCIDRGYNFIKTDSFGEEINEEDRLFNMYSNGRFKITFIISNKRNNLGYQIAIEKL